MKTPSLKLLMTSAALAGLATLAIPAQATGPRDSAVSADRYGYVFHAFHASRFDVYSDGARLDPAAPPVPVASASQLRRPDPYSDGAQKLAGWDRTGVSSDPARKIDTFQDGAHA
ncbi:hypothetical protein AB4Z48_20615 [Cupriavidus sp. 2TAF22]|uniref:hypothetical protein n=1 Tax=unclassified Cupriavidus TaxID=2640874 RepID=UPI003F91DAF8